MGLYLTKRITRPVQLLAAAAREIGAGRLGQRVEPQSNDEFGSLVEAFNAMREGSRYVRGMFAWMGFRQIGVPYARQERAAGATVYPANSFRSQLEAL